MNCQLQNKFRLTDGTTTLLDNAVITGTVTADTWPHMIASTDATDVISRFFEWLFAQIGNLSPSTFHFPIKALLLFLMPFLLCKLYMRRHPATVFSQVTLAVAGILIVGAIPVDRLEIANSMIKTWLWIGCTVALLFLPRLLATVVVPTVGAQRRLTIVLYILLAVLFLLNTVELGGK
jgi:hypothetical protein